MQKCGIMILMTSFIWLASNNDNFTYGCECFPPDPNAEIVVGEGENEERFKEIVVCMGDVVNFSGSNSRDPDETELSYSWDFGDGADGESGADSVSASCYYTTSGEKTVTLTVTDDDRTACCGEGPTCEDKSDTDDEVEVTVVGIASLDLADPNAATLIEEDDNTKVYAVCVADAGYLVVRAAPEPNMLEPELPDCWSLTGGTKQDELHTHVYITQPDIITVTCTAGTSSKSVTIYVVQVNLAVEGLAEPDEEDPGKYINVNWDDDDGDGWDPNDEAPPGASYIGDKDDPNIVSGDSDFRFLWIDLLPSDIPVGQVTLTYSNNVKVWDTATKRFYEVDGESSAISSGTSFEPNELDDALGVKWLYLEGVSGSEEFRDVEVKASYSAGGSTIHEDVVKVTVFEVDPNGLFGFDSQQEDNDKRMDGSTGTGPPGSSNNCGRISWDDKDADGIKWPMDDKDPNCTAFHNCMELQGTVDPNGVTDEVAFDFIREKWRRYWYKVGNDPNWSLEGDATPWKPDEPTSLDEDLTPSEYNHIYQYDVPGFADKLRRASYDYVAYIANFRERVMVQIEGGWYQCSDYYKWHAQLYTEPKAVPFDAFMTRDSMNKQKLGAGWIVVPDNP